MDSSRKRAVKGKSFQCYDVVIIGQLWVVTQMYVYGLNETKHSKAVSIFYQTHCTLKTESCYGAKFVVTGGTLSSQNGSLQGHQWRQSCHNDISRCSIFILTWERLGVVEQGRWQGAVRIRAIGGSVVIGMIGGLPGPLKGRLRATSGHRGRPGRVQMILYRSSIGIAVNQIGIGLHPSSGREGCDPGQVVGGEGRLWGQPEVGVGLRGFRHVVTWKGHRGVAA